MLKSVVYGWSWNGLKKSLAIPANTRRQWIDETHLGLSVTRQCELLGLPRSTYYYQPQSVSAEYLQYLRRLDEQYLLTPCFGSRRMARILGGSRERARQAMRLMGLTAIYPRPRTSLADKQHRIYPYLLRNCEIRRPNQVWASDITYIPMARGFLYLTVVLDWFSRHVLSWRLSNTLDGAFCLEALEEALQYGRPEIFNTDQGCQYTAQAFTSRLEAAGVAISMNGRGRALDNVFVERLWRTVKYEEVYIKNYQDGWEAAKSLEAFFYHYSYTRPHQSLGYRTPAAVYGAARN